MNIEQLREKFPGDITCRKFFVLIIWHHGRRCPHCNCERFYPLSEKKLMDRAIRMLQIASDKLP